MTKKSNLDTVIPVRYKCEDMGLLATNDDDQKPLAARWFKKAGKDARSTVCKIKLSSSGEWIIIDCLDCVGLLSAQSKVGVALWQIVTQFEGQLRTLEIKYARGKIGFDLEPGTETTTWHTNLLDDEVTCEVDPTFAGGDTTGTPGIATLSLENMKPLPAASTPSRFKSNGKQLRI